MQLPIRDKKQLEKVLPFELEAFLPFEMSQLVIDFDITEQTKNHTSLLAFAVKKEFIQQYLSLFQGLDNEPQVIDIDVLSLGNIVHISNLPTAGLCALLDLGHQKSSLCIIKNGRVVGVRTFFTAGKAITDALRVELDLTYQQAEEVKHKYGAAVLEAHPSKDPKQQKISKAITKILGPMILEVNQTIHNYESSAQPGSEQVNKLETIYISGGSSLIRGIDQWIAETSRKKVEFVHCTINSSPLEIKIGKKEPVMIQAISLGLRTSIRGISPDRLSRVNLRKDEFALVKDYKELRGKFRSYGIWAAVLMGLAMVEFFVNYWSLSSQAKGLEQTIIKEITRVAPDLPKNKINSGKQAVAMVQSRIKQYGEKVDLLTSGLKSLTALDVLREISALPRSLAIDVKDISIDKSKISLKADTDSFTTVDKIVSFLEKYEHFKKIDKGPITDSPEGSKKRFSLSILVGDKELEKNSKAEPKK
jgi:Tfp pilus assembly PilM family ATPase